MKSEIDSIFFDISIIDSRARYQVCYDNKTMPHHVPRPAIPFRD